MLAEGTPSPPSLDSPPAALPAELLEYLINSPLPTLVLTNPSLHHAPPLLTNFTFLQLTRGQTAAAVLSEQGKAALERWLRQPYRTTASTLTGSETDDPAPPDDDLELALHLATDVMQAVLFRRTVFGSGGPSRTPGVVLGDGSGGSVFIVTGVTLPPKRLSRWSGTEQLDTVVRKVLHQEGGREERSLPQKLAELELLYERSAVGLARLDMEGRVLATNTSWLDITQHEEGVPIAEWSRCLDQESYWELVNGFKTVRENLTPLVVRLKMKTGSYLLAHATPNSTDPDLITGWIANLTDVTAQVKAEEALALLAQEREQALRQAQAVEAAEARRRDAEEQRKNQELLIDTTSHELRNPISAILQNAELTRSSLAQLYNKLIALKDEGRLPIELDGFEAELVEDIEAVESVGECARAQERIANDILGMAQIGANRYNVTPLPFRLLASLNSSVHMFSTEGKSKGIDLSLRTGPLLASLNDDLTVVADPTRLGQIIVNLISNAVRFTALRPTRKITLEVDVSAVPPPEGSPIVPPAAAQPPLLAYDSPLYIYCSVADSGPGMRPDETERVFERFMQASPLTHVKMGGNGLGLWIARNLCELHGGRIEVVSEVDVGSTFRFFVRAGTCPLSALATPEHVPSPQFSSTLMRILVAEDNVLNRKILIRQLSREGHRVVTAADGQQAVDSILAGEKEGNPFDCCIMDIEMPILDGISATRAIRSLEASAGKPRLRIIGCSGNARDAQVRAALDSGMDGLVTKPYRLEELLKALVISS